MDGDGADIDVAEAVHLFRQVSSLRDLADALALRAVLKSRYLRFDDAAALLREVEALGARLGDDLIVESASSSLTELEEQAARGVEIIAVPPRAGDTNVERETLAHAEFLVSGRVSGTGFRSFVEQAAATLGVAEVRREKFAGWSNSGPRNGNPQPTRCARAGIARGTAGRKRDGRREGDHGRAASVDSA